jgi:hypothetical protein
MMIKSELIELLNAIEGDPPIILSGDEEGNRFSTLEAVEDSPLVDGEPVHPDDAPRNADRCICLWP